MTGGHQSAQTRGRPAHPAGPCDRCAVPAVGSRQRLAPGPGPRVVRHLGVVDRPGHRGPVHGRPGAGRVRRLGRLHAVRPDRHRGPAHRPDLDAADPGSALPSDRSVIVDRCGAGRQRPSRGDRSGDRRRRTAPTAAARRRDGGRGPRRPHRGSPAAHPAHPHTNGPAIRARGTGVDGAGGRHPVVHRSEDHGRPAALPGDLRTQSRRRAAGRRTAGHTRDVAGSRVDPPVACGRGDRGPTGGGPRVGGPCPGAGAAGGHPVADRAGRARRRHPIPGTRGGEQDRRSRRHRRRSGHRHPAAGARARR